MIYVHWLYYTNVQMSPAQIDSLQKYHLILLLLSPFHFKKETKQEISLKQAVSRHFWQIPIPTKLKISQEQPVIQNFSASVPRKCRNR